MKIIVLGHSRACALADLILQGLVTKEEAAKMVAAFEQNHEEVDQSFVRQSEGIKVEVEGFSKLLVKRMLSKADLHPRSWKDQLPWYDKKRKGRRKR